jgi:hypothetical protein
MKEAAMRRKNAGMSLVSGILSIVAGAGGIVGALVLITVSIGGLTLLDRYNADVVAVISTTIALIWLLLGILAIVGGVFALRRKAWPIALAGAIGATFCSGVIGIASLIFIIKSRPPTEK